VPVRETEKLPQPSIEYTRIYAREPLVADIAVALSWLGNENRAVLSLNFRIIVSKQAGVHYS
jgi:hypothetical protein